MRNLSRSCSFKEKHYSENEKEPSESGGKYKKYEVSFDYCKQVAASYAGMLEHVDGNRFKDKLWEDFVLTHNMEE